MERMGLKVEDSSIKYTHANRTLVISYTKPGRIMYICSFFVLSKVHNVGRFKTVTHLLSQSY